MNRYYETISTLPQLPTPGYPPRWMPTDLLWCCGHLPLAQKAITAVFEKATLWQQKVVTDEMWERYLNELASVALAVSSSFLMEYAKMEQQLSRALRSERVKQKALEPSTDETEEAVYTEILAMAAQWASEADPVAAYAGLLEHKRSWIETRSKWFSFALDEMVGYAAMMLVDVELAAIKGRFPSERLRTLAISRSLERRMHG